MKIIIAPDSYKGCLSSREVAESIAEGITGHETIMLPMSDGGEGMLDTFLSAMKGERVTVCVHDPLMRLIDAEYGISDDTAIIEIAQAIGIHLVEKEQRNPLKTTSYGVGEMIGDAYQRGIRKFIIGLGGSAVSDCGIGMLRALGERKAGETKLWEEIRKDAEFCLASDVTNPLLGENGAAHVYAPQKGATPEMVRILEERGRGFAEACSRHFDIDRRNDAGAGAAGGLGYAFMQFFNAKMQSGAELLLEKMHFDENLKGADIVITGEGHSERQTLMGKLPFVVMQHAKKIDVPVWLVSGGVSDKEYLLAAGFDKVIAVTPVNQPLDEALKPDVAKQNIRNVVRET